MKKMAIFMSVLVVTIFFISKIEASSAVYKINPNSNTLGGVFKNYSTYNTNTKHYYLIRSYLEELEKKKGGTLVLQKGTYTITNVLYVPSNVTIKLEDGVILKKGTKTNTTFAASKSMFQFISPSKSEKKGIVGGHNGEKNITIIGYGTAKIDLANMEDSIAIIAGHNYNIKIINVQFLNMKGGHFIELDASLNVTIKDNEFVHSKATKEDMKEAINIDTPDKLTEGWSQDWSKYDKTPNVNVLIDNNVFFNIDVAVGTHNYSEGKYHNNIVIKNNVIDRMRTNGVSVMNWSNSTIENNTIKNIVSEKGRGVIVRGSKNVTIRKNTMQNLARPIEYMVWKNDGRASVYKESHNAVNLNNQKALETNSIQNGAEGFIRMYRTYNNYSTNIIVFPLQVKSLKTKPLVMYISASGGYGYKLANKNSGAFIKHEMAEQVKVYHQGENWYHAFTKVNGKWERVFYHEDEIQATKPMVAKPYYISKGGAKGYQMKNKTSKVNKKFEEGTKVNLFSEGDGWYYRNDIIDGKSVRSYLHEDNVQVEQPFIPRLLYVSRGGAPMYKQNDKTKEQYGMKEEASAVNIQSMGNNWYYGYENINGKEVKVYYHEDHIQGTKPNI